MVKPDVRHNYYADLDLSTTATIDDIRKAYRKLALQYHPDRNAGNEADCVPRFQAIQAANEVLSDPTVKAKYDQDRRKAGLYPGGFKPAGAHPPPPPPTTGNPYQASSAFPPPPRRTQPGTWQRPASSAYAQQAGADRFTNFPKSSAAGSTPRKDPAAERTQQFRAWQSMNSGTGAPRYGGQPPPPPPRSPNPPAQTQNTARPRMQRQDTKMPTEEQIRAGMRHGKAAAAGAEGPAAEKQSAWQAFQSSNSGKPGVSRKQRTAPTTPRRPGGFDPNAPGSDERPAPTSTGHYSHRHRSEDTGADGMYPPPPPGPAPATSPDSPVSPQTQRPFVNPLRPFAGDDVPYAEGNRKSTPYSSFSGEKLQFNSDGLRRSASTRDTSRLNAEFKPGTSFRARSSSPPAGGQTKDNKPFVAGTTSDSSDANSSEVTEDSSSMDRDFTDTPERYDSNAEARTRPSVGPSRNSSFPPQTGRQFIKPTTRRANLSSKSSSSRPVDGSTGDAQSDGNQPSMQQRKSSTNMYDHPSPFIATPSFNRGEWAASAFGSLKGPQESRATIPPWAFPCSILPVARVSRQERNVAAPRTPPTWDQEPVNQEKDPLWDVVSVDMRQAYCLFRTKLHLDVKARGDDVELLNQLDLETFIKLVSITLNGHSTGHAECDARLLDALTRFPSIRLSHMPPQLADNASANSFSIPVNHDTFTHTTGKSRSVEDINTNFSPEGWTPSFQGTPDYFAATGRKPSPARRTFTNRPGRPATVDNPPSANDSMPPHSRAPGQPASSTFNEDVWKNSFRDASWMHPAVADASKNTSKETAAGVPVGTKEKPHVIPDDEPGQGAARMPRTMHGSTVFEDAEMMDIDTPSHVETTKHTASTEAASSKEARLYSVPPSVWRKSQGQQQGQGYQGMGDVSRAAEDVKMNVNMDDLSHVEPLARNSDGLKNLADMSSTLPFESQAGSNAQSKEPTKLQLPPVPKVPEKPDKLTRESWHLYALQFGTYLQAFHGFNKTVLAHFDARQKQSEMRLSRGTQWLEAAGETSEHMGFDSYIKGVREDEQVREAWNIASERHLESVREFDQTRERVRKLAAQGML